MSSNVNTGIIFNIQRYNIHDGPGIRTCVFFKGCPLRCLWCFNPESQRQEKEVVYYPSKCIQCGICVENCAQAAQSANYNIIEKINRNCCNNCGKCTELCPSGALMIYGRFVEVQEI